LFTLKCSDQVIASGVRLFLSSTCISAVRPSFKDQLFSCELNVICAQPASHLRVFWFYVWLVEK